MIIILFIVSAGTIYIIAKNSEEKDRQLNHARMECIEMNRRYNELFQFVGKQYFGEEMDEYGIAGSCLMEMMKTMLPVNEALGIDCTNYNEDGNPIYIADEDGVKHTGQILPNELRLVNQQ